MSIYYHFFYKIILYIEKDSFLNHWNFANYSIVLESVFQSSKPWYCDNCLNDTVSNCLISLFFFFTYSMIKVWPLAAFTKLLPFFSLCPYFLVSCFFLSLFNQQPCFKCGKKTRTKTIQCPAQSCAKYYHPKCLGGKNTK